MKQYIAPNDLEPWQLRAIREDQPDVEPINLYHYWWGHPDMKKREDALDHFEDVFALARLRGKGPRNGT